MDLTTRWDVLGGVESTFGFEYRKQAFLGDYPLISVRAKTTGQSIP